MVCFNRLWSFNRLFRKKCPKMVFFLPKKSGFWSKGLFFTRDARDFFCKIVRRPLNGFSPVLSCPLLSCWKALGQIKKSINCLHFLNHNYISIWRVDQCCPLMSYPKTSMVLSYLQVGPFISIISQWGMVSQRCFDPWFRLGGWLPLTDPLFVLGLEIVSEPKLANRISGLVCKKS